MSLALLTFPGTIHIIRPKLFVIASCSWKDHRTGCRLRPPRVNRTTRKYIQLSAHVPFRLTRRADLRLKATISTLTHHTPRRRALLHAPARPPPPLWHLSSSADDAQRRGQPPCVHTGVARPAGDPHRHAPRGAEDTLLPCRHAARRGRRYAIRCAIGGWRWRERARYTAERNDAERTGRHLAHVNGCRQCEQRRVILVFHRLACTGGPRRGPHTRRRGHGRRPARGTRFDVFSSLDRDGPTDARRSARSSTDGYGTRDAGHPRMDQGARGRGLI